MFVLVPQFPVVGVFTNNISEFLIRLIATTFRSWIRYKKKKGALALILFSLING